MSGLERRFTAGRVETRAVAEKRTIGGYAAKFNRMSENLGGFVEVVRPSFFNRSRSFDWPDVLARYNHDDNMLLGSTAAGTLRLRIDDTGLEYDVDLPQARSDVYELVQRGDIQRSSFAFMVDEDEWATSDQGYPQRSLVSGKLADVAPVNTPAYKDTSVGLRSLAAKFGADLEEVRQLAEEDKLMKFFRRTPDGKPKPKPISTAQALAIVQSIPEPDIEPY